MNKHYIFYNLSNHLNKNFKNVTYSIINLKKHQQFNSNVFKKDTKLIINSGKVLIDIYIPSVLKNYNSKEITYSTKLKSPIIQSLFAENNKLTEFKIDHDLILTQRKYILQILPHRYFSIYSHENSTIQLFN
jgi:hypothetical protein